MPEVVTGSPGNQGSNPSGVGAVIFDKTIDPLQLHMENLKASDDVILENKKLQAQKFALISKMSGALNPNLKGVFPADIPIIQQTAGKVHQAMLDYVRGGMKQEDYLTLQNTQTELTSQVAASQDSNLKMAKFTAALDADAKGKQELDHSAGATGLASVMKMPLVAGDGNDRMHLTDWESKIIVPKPPDLDMAINKYIDGNIKAFGGKLQTHTVPVAPPAGQDKNSVWENQVSENITPGQIDYFKNNYQNMPAINAEVQKEWNGIKEQTPGVIDSLKKPYIDAGVNPVLAEKKAQADWVAGRVLNGHYQKSDNYIYKGLNEQGKLDIARVKADAADDKNILYGPTKNYADLLTGVPGAALAFVGKPQTPYRQLQLDADGNVIKGSNGQPIYQPMNNAIESVEQLPGGGVDIVTTESRDKRAELNWESKTNPLSISVTDKIHFGKNDMRALMQFVEGTSKTGNDLNNMDKAARKLQSVGTSGEIDPDAYKENYRKAFGNTVGGRMTNTTSTTATQKAAASTGGQNTDTAAKAKQILASAGKASDDAAVQLFLKNNPNFK